MSWRNDPHCDHQAAYCLARAASRALGAAHYEYCVWGATLPPNTLVTPVVSGFRLRIDAHRLRKRRAIAAYRSQLGVLIEDDPDGFRLAAEDLARFSGPFESFMESVE